MQKITLEVCVDEVAGLHAAVEGGADRIELCSSLELGGLTPSAGLMLAASELALPVHALIRPRAGGFVYTEAEARVMLHDIEQARRFGLAGLAIGALTPQGDLDLPLLRRCIHAAAGLQLTLHRAFDVVRDPQAALEDAVALGFHRILSSGGARTAAAGAARLAALVKQSQGRLRMLAASGIHADNVQALLSASQVPEVHASCRAPAEPLAADLLALGFASTSPARQTSAAQVRALKQRLLAQA